MKCLYEIALLNIRAKKFKYTVIFLILFLTTVFLYIGTLLTDSMGTGLDMARAKLGANILLLPRSYIEDGKNKALNTERLVDDILFNGKPCTLYFPAAYEDTVRGIAGVKNVCSQVYLSTLAGAGCCDGKTQLIAFDFDTDFVIAPWIDRDIKELKDGEIIFGANHGYEVGDTVKFYNKKFTVVSKLQKTGLGYDGSAFISYESAQDILNQNPDKFEFSDVSKIVSMIFVQNDPETTAGALKEKIEWTVDMNEVVCYTANNKINSIAGMVSSLKIFGRITDIMLLTVSALGIFALVVNTTVQRKNEIGSMITVGITKEKIIGIFLLEHFIILFLSVASSLVLSQGIILLFAEKIAMSIENPFILPGLRETLILAGKVFGINTVILFLAVLFPVYWIYRTPPANMVKEIS